MFNIIIERKMMKGILINAEKETISVVEHDGDISTLYELLGCRTIEAVYPFKHQDVIYIDEEGLLKDSNFSFTIWTDDKREIPLFGNGIVVGTDEEGNDIACQSILEDIKHRVTFRGKVHIENDGQGFNITPWHIYQANLNEIKLLLEKLKTEGSA